MINTQIPYYQFNRDTSDLRKVPVYNSKTDFGQKADEFTLSKNLVKNNKKKLLAFGALLALIGIAGVIFSKRKNISIFQEGRKILSKKDKILKESTAIADNAQKEYNSTVKILKESQKEGYKRIVDEKGRIVRNFTQKNNLCLMQEMSGLNIERETQFDPNNLEIKTISKGVKRTGIYSAKTKQTYAYNQNKLISYSEDVSGNIYDTINTKAKMRRYFCFDKDGKLLFNVNDVNINGEKLDYGERFIFVDDKLRTYEEGVKCRLDKSRIKKQINFEADGKISGYKANKTIAYNPTLNEKTENAEISYSLNKNGFLEQDK